MSAEDEARAEAHRRYPMEDGSVPGLDRNTESRRGFIAGAEWQASRKVEATAGNVPCMEKCWTPVACPDHGDMMNPFGRSAPLGAEGCCGNYADSDINPRHLWDEHDSTRWYTDPEGWAEHERACPVCGTTETEETQ